MDIREFAEHLLVSPVRIGQQCRVVKIEFRESRLNGVWSSRHPYIRLLDFCGIVRQAVQSGICGIDVAIVKSSGEEVSYLDGA